MNAAISLCSFCDEHGPKMVFNTQAFKDFDYEDDKKLSFYGSKEILKKIMFAKSQDCKECSSLGYLKYLSNMHETRTSFFSSQKFLLQDIESHMSRACLRSLSSEEYATGGREGISYFDEPCGHFLCYTFALKDAQSRGFRKLYSFVVFMRDQQFLLNLWAFIVANLSELIRELQSIAEQKFNAEKAQCPQKSIHITSNSRPNFHMNAIDQSGNPIEMTDNKYLYLRIHLWFVWILCVGTTHHVEVLPLTLVEEDINFKVNRLLEMDRNFNLQSAKYPVNLKINSRVPYFKELLNLNPVTILRSLKHKLGKDQFRQILYAVLVGIQILLRGSAEETLVIMYALCSLVPRACRSVKTQAKSLTDTTMYNFISVDTSVAVPLPCAEICRLDIVPANQRLENTRSYTVKWTGVLPSKLPNLFIKLDKALDNEKLNDALLESNFLDLQMQWINIAKVVHATHGQIHRADLTNLMINLGAGLQDKKLLDAWAMGLPSNPA